MNIKNTPIKPRKIPYYLSLFFLFVGASLILGFLSFGGMYTLIPMLSLSFAAFGLSVAYEAEIYLQNIKGALTKLLKPDYLRNTLAKEFLIDHFPDTQHDDCPQFFKDYEAQLRLLNKFSHKNLDEESNIKKQQIETTLKDMRKWFALQLFASDQTQNEAQSAYAEQVKNWLSLENQEQKVWQNKLLKRQTNFRLTSVFSLFSGAFMSLGTTYLVVEAFSVIPFLAAIPFTVLPFIVLPMAAIAGAAYGLLTYNTVTDMINNDTLRKWYFKLKNDIGLAGWTPRNIFMATTAVLLVVLALTLTIFTAGTWWTVATQARPIFEWMRMIPSFVMGAINPIITGLSAIFFNIENTSETLNMVYNATLSDTPQEKAEEATDETVFTRFYNVVGKVFTFIKDNMVLRPINAVREAFNRLRENENWLQILNPFRIILKLTITPLRILLFLGHLISIGLTADRMPGVPQIIAAITSMISEGFEDAHYFIGQDHDESHHSHDIKTLLREHLEEEHGHNHDEDIPTAILKFLATPLYFMAAAWDSLFGNLSFDRAWNKQRGIQEEQHVVLKDTAKRPSDQWRIEHTVFLIEKYQAKHFQGVVIGSDLADAKNEALEQLQKNVSATSDKDGLANVLNEPQSEILNQHRLFSSKDTKTYTQQFVEHLPQRVLG